jgi:hypothetical protein
MNSSFNPIYTHLCCEQFDMPSYLGLGLPREVINVIAQIRTVGRFKLDLRKIPVETQKDKITAFMKKLELWITSKKF